MRISKSAIIYVILIIILVIAGFLFLQSIFPSQPRANLIITDTKLSTVNYGINEFLLVHANITNKGHANATNIVLSIETYFPNGTESYLFTMTLWQNQTLPANSSEIPPTNVTINAGQSYLVQSGNYEHINDIETPLEPNLPGVPYQLINNSFFAHYKITLSYETT